MNEYVKCKTGYYKCKICETCVFFEEDAYRGEHCAGCGYPDITTGETPMNTLPTNYAPVVHEQPPSGVGTIGDWLNEVHKTHGHVPDPTANPTFDAVSHPSHYTEGRQYEPRKVIHDWGLNFNLGNAVKYISRAGRKGDALEDLKKARQYLDFEIEEMEKEDK